jgi:hypothetical protein
MNVEQPVSPRRFSEGARAQVAAALAEVLRADSFHVECGPGMGFDGVTVVPAADTAAMPGASSPYWYFSNSFGGDDGFSDHLRVYYTTSGGDCVDDNDPVGAPLADGDPVEIARWIVDVVRSGDPSSGPAGTPSNGPDV